MRKKTFIQKIPDSQIVDGNIYASIPFYNNFIMFNSNGLVYHFVDENVNDDCFYHFNDCIFTKQEMTFCDFYVSVSDGSVFQHNVTKSDNGDVWLISELCEFSEQNANIVNKEELYEMFNRENVFVISLNGKIYDAVLPTEDEIVNIYKEILKNKINIYKSSVKNPIFNRSDLSFFDSKLLDMSIVDVPCDFKFINDDILLVECISGKVKMQVVSIRFMSSGVYKVISKSVLLKEYSLGQLQQMLKSSIYMTLGTIATFPIEVPDSKNIIDNDGKNFSKRYKCL